MAAMTESEWKQFLDDPKVVKLALNPDVAVGDGNNIYNASGLSWELMHALAMHLPTSKEVVVIDGKGNEMQPAVEFQGAYITAIGFCSHDQLLDMARKQYTEASDRSAMEPFSVIEQSLVWEKVWSFDQIFVEELGRLMDEQLFSRPTASSVDL